MSFEITNTTDLTRDQPDTENEKHFDWPVCYEAEKFVLDRMQAFLSRNLFAAALAGRMRNETGTLMIDWVDHLIIPENNTPALLAAGFTEDPSGDPPANGQRVFRHSGALLPRVITDRNSSDISFPPVLAIRVESISDFLKVHALHCSVEGEPLTRFRQLTASTENNTRFDIVERRGYRGFVPMAPPEGYIDAAFKADELWNTRTRIFDEDAEGFLRTQAVLDQVIGLVGRDLACHIVFAREREYWERRNHAAQIQKQRQDRLGLGWANHDHHTFRCSRENFVEMMHVLEKLGFKRRERYYAGAEAGWGAQILEQPVEGIVAFCDVDLEPDETEIDFSHQKLTPATHLGTVGLWVGLHGESLLDAGLHHLECRFDFHLLREQLEVDGIKTMNPFSDFPFLKQAFTEGERWPVRRGRVQRLLSAELITKEQFYRFTHEGALGSHLENLQRHGGFKGFNQQSVSAIIHATDPRKENQDL